MITYQGLQFEDLEALLQDPKNLVAGRPRRRKSISGFPSMKDELRGWNRRPRGPPSPVC